MTTLRVFRPTAFTSTSNSKFKWPSAIFLVFFTKTCQQFRIFTINLFRLLFLWWVFGLALDNNNLQETILYFYLVRCPTRLSSIIFQHPKNREIYRSHVPPLPLLQGIAHLEREKHKILDDDDREQASVNLLKRWQHQKYQCCYQGQAFVNLLRDKKNIKGVSVVIMN